MMTRGVYIVDFLYYTSLRVALGVGFGATGWWPRKCIVDIPSKSYFRTHIFRVINHSVNTVFQSYKTPFTVNMGKTSLFVKLLYCKCSLH